MIDIHKIRGEWKIQLTTQINFIFSLDTGESCKMNSKTDNVEIMMDIETDRIIKKLFEPFFERYQERLETKMEGSNFVFVYLLYYSLHKISLNRERSYIDSPSWIKHKGATINPKK